MYTNFKSPLFQKHDVTAFTTQFKESIQQSVDSPSSTNLTVMSRTFDCLAYAMVVPLLAEEVFATAQPNIMTQIEMLQVRLQKWPQNEQSAAVLSSLRTLVKRCYATKALQAQLSKVKMPAVAQDG